MCSPRLDNSATCDLSSRHLPATRCVASHVEHTRSLGLQTSTTRGPAVPGRSSPISLAQHRRARSSAQRPCRQPRASPCPLYPCRASLTAKPPSAEGRSSDASDRTVRDEANTAAATADSVADEANALLDDNPFEQPRYAFRPRTHDLRARLRTADVSPAKDPEAALEPYDLPAKGSRRSEEERKWARALLLSSPDWAGLPDDKKDFNAAVLFVRASPTSA